MYLVGMDVDTFVFKEIVKSFEYHAICGENNIIYSFIITQSQLKEKIRYLKYQSAGNYFMCHNVATISDHIINNHHYNYEQFGYYQAGLIEGDGNFGDRRLEIVLNKKDIKQAYYLRKQIGYGLIYPSNSVKFVIRKEAGQRKIQELCNGKFMGRFKLDQQANRNWAKDIILQPPMSNTVNQNNYPWQSGFIDADGSQGIFIVNSKTHKQRCSVRLEIKISQKHLFLLNIIYSSFNGSSQYKDKKGIHHWKLTGQKNQKSQIDYQDIYPLKSEKYKQYIIFRNTFRMMNRKEHLTESGQQKIRKKKFKISAIYKDSSETIRMTP